jgi:hypothetical protein
MRDPGETRTRNKAGSFEIDQSSGFLPICLTDFLDIRFLQFDVN